MRTSGTWLALILVLAAAPVVWGEAPADPLADAFELAATRPGMQVMRVAGDSMRPFFSDGAVVVVKTVSAEHLAPGMVVVYRNRFGETITHRLLARVAGGWRVKGESNREPDTTLVTPRNLIGMVYAIFSSAPNESVALARVEVVLAAPAR